MKHRQPDGRAIHPECEALDGSGLNCTCDEAWGFEGGTAEELDDAILTARKMEGRNQPFTTTGSMPDADEAGEDLHRGLKRLSMGHPDEILLRGFWKRSEDLACRAGKRMTEIKDYGLPAPPRGSADDHV